MPGRLGNQITFTAIMRIIDGSIQDYPAGRARADADAMHEYAFAITFLNESLTYSAFYQGVFSAQKQIGIADVSWDTSSIQMVETGEPAIETRMAMS